MKIEVEVEVAIYEYIPTCKEFFWDIKTYVCISSGTLGFILKV